VSGFLQLIHQSDGKILKRNAASLRVGQQLVVAKPEFAGPLASYEEG
jgi:hypothetical protein